MEKGTEQVDAEQKGTFRQDHGPIASRKQLIDYPVNGKWKGQLEQRGGDGTGEV
ncbi:hypothetical protein D3C74_477440 [compost metagenome]